MVGALINTTCAGKTNLLFGVIKEGLENIIIVSVGGGYCQPTAWTGWNKSVSCLVTSGGTSGDASTNSKGEVCHSFWARKPWMSRLGLISLEIQ